MENAKEAVRKTSQQLSPKQLYAIWLQRYAALTKLDIVIGLVIVLVLWIANGAFFFGLNFWLWSFNQQSNSNFISIWLPSLIWAIGYFVPVSIYKLCTGERSGFFLPVLRQPKAALTLILIGFLDSLGGLTAVYSTKPTPIFLQTMLYATGPIWTFFLTKALYPERARPFTVYPAMAFALIFFGICVSGAHQFSSAKINSPSDFLWVLIYLASIVIPAAYGIISGKFIYDHVKTVQNYNSTYMMVLCGDTLSQMFFSTMYFPLDAVPWFGSAPYSIEASWNGFVEALRCVTSCPDNGLYMFLYCGGFWVAHVVGVVLNHYSPTLYSVVSLLNGPLYVFMLMIFPALRVNGAPGLWYLDVICFLCLLVACIMFALWEESVRFAQGQQQTVDAEDQECSSPTPSEDFKALQVDSSSDSSSSEDKV